MDSRIIDLRNIGKFEVGIGFYQFINQGSILDQFKEWYPSDPSSGSIIYLRSRENPVKIYNSSRFKNIVYNQTKPIWEHQFCLQSNGPVDLDRILSISSTNEIDLVNIAHLVAHILLTFGLRYVDPWISRDFLISTNFAGQELVYSNLHNPLESIIAFNFPARVGPLAEFTSITLEYMDAWISGKSTTDYISRMRRQDENSSNHYPNL